MKRNDSSGALTGATGDLTPDDDPQAFVPAERREMSDPEHQGDVTAAHGRSAPAQQGDIGLPGESNDGGGAPRDGGSGSAHGLSGADPAYRMESRPEGDSDDERRPRPDSGEHRANEDGGDEFADREDHF